MLSLVSVRFQDGDLEDGRDGLNNFQIDWKGDIHLVETPWA